MSSFSLPGLSKAMTDNLATLGFTEPTPIQREALPLVLSGKDVIGMAKTGSGKTAAFGIGMIEKLNVRRFVVQSLVLCPTRELADQVARAIRELARAHPNVKVLTLCGGVPLGPQIGSLEHGAHIIVGTPGRIQDHLDKQTLSLRGVNMLVLDEADRMLDMGFRDAIEAIISHCPKDRQTLMFSATWPDSIRELSGRFQSNPAEVTVAESAQETAAIEEQFYEVPRGAELDALVGLLSREQPASCIVFCGTRKDCDEVASGLGQRGFSALPLHGDLDQKDRDQVLIRFSNRSCSLLVATDVAARGLDIEDLPLVVNLEPARTPETHTHRIGRTGRAGARGLAVTFFTPAKAHKIVQLEQARGEPLKTQSAQALIDQPEQPFYPPMVTICIAGGRKDKVRPGDILGALTGEGGLAGDQIGRINIQEFQSFVAVDSAVSKQAFQCLEHGKIKGRRFRVRRV
ncbi:ATP-dependent RNA helicase DbpA [uncultured Marinobacter sp.]|uniref:ATP-dependent RNA helicase DbpA n=1 Tax=uncultured Marinobacter sp. TaxID=187379 RepID=UPI0030D77840